MNGSIKNNETNLQLKDGHSMIVIAHHQLNGSGDTKNVYHFIDMSMVLILRL